jgi:preprotein translocase subunit SecD
MNRYPLWKYLLIAASVVIGLLYTLPNFYGEVPAVQVSPLRSNLKADAALMARIEEALKKGSFEPSGIALDANSVKARFAGTEEQIKAKDALQTALGEDYVVALNLLSRSPQWLASIGALPMYLGLDLRGGVHFLMQVDMKAALSKKLGCCAKSASSIRGCRGKASRLRSGSARPRCVTRHWRRSARTCLIWNCARPKTAASSVSALR